MTNVEFYLKDLESRMKGLKGEEYYCLVWEHDKDVPAQILLNYCMEHYLDNKVMLLLMEKSPDEHCITTSEKYFSVLRLGLKRIAIYWADSEYCKTYKITSCLQADGAFFPFYDVTEEWIEQVVMELKVKGEIN